MITWFLFGAMCLGVVFFLAACWKLNRLHTQTKAAFDQLQNHLKNRAEFVHILSLTAGALPQLDPQVLSKLQTLRQTAAHTPVLSQRAEQEQQIAQLFASIFQAAQNNPQLTQNETFVKLKNNILKANQKVQRSTRKYNQSARDFNLVSSIIPLNLIAAIFELSPYAYFEPQTEPEQPAPTAETAPAEPAQPVAESAEAAAQPVQR